MGCLQSPATSPTLSHIQNSQCSQAPAPLPTTPDPQQRSSTTAVSLFEIIQMELLITAAPISSESISNIKRIISRQNLLFHGFIRLGILNQNVSDHKIFPLDIINLCLKYFEIDITYLLSLKEEIELAQSIQEEVFNCLEQNQQYFLGYELAKILANHTDRREWKIMGNFYIALIYGDWKPFDEADIAYKDVIELLNHNSGFSQEKQIRYCYGNFLGKNARFNEAIAQFSLIFNMEPEDDYTIEAAQGIIACCEGLNDFESAEKIYLEMIEKDPDNPWWRHNYGRLLNENNASKDRVLVQMLEAVKLNPDVGESTLAVGSCYQDLKDYKNAEEMYIKAIKLFEKDGDVRSQCRGNRWYAQLFKEQEMYDKALEHYNLALSLCPGRVSIITQMGMCYENMKDYDNAKKLYLNAMEKFPNDAELIYYYGGFLMDAVKNYQEALVHLKKALELNPDEEKREKHILALSDCYRKMKDYDNLEKLFIEAIEKNPTNSRFIYCYGKSLRFELKKHDEAIIQFRKALELDPNNYEYTVGLADCCKDMTSFEEAGIHYLKAIEIEPENISSYLKYAKMLRNDCEDYKESEKYFLKCLEIDNRNSSVNASYALLLYKMGNYEKAMKYAKITTEIRGDSSFGAYYNYAYFSNLIGNDQESEKALKKSVNLVKDEHLNMIFEEEERIKKEDPLQIDFNKKFVQMLKQRDEK